MDANSRKILIVDDECVIADTLCMIFLTKGYDAHATYSAEQAIEIVAGWVPDLVIVDVILPGMNGIDLAVALSQQVPNCRVLLFSGQTSTSDLLLSAATNGYTFEILAKPVHPTDMLAAARRLLTAEKQSVVTAEPNGPSTSEGSRPRVD